MEVPFAVLEPPLARPSPVPTGMMQSQALATLVIIRQIVQQRVTWLTLRTFLEIAVAGVIIQ